MPGSHCNDPAPGEAAASSPSVEAGRVSAEALAAWMVDARRMAHLAAVFSNPTRSKILLLLASHGSLGVTTLAILTGSSVSLVSHNLALMKTEGWVSISRMGRLREVRIASAQRLNAVLHLREAAGMARPQATPPCSAVQFIPAGIVSTHRSAFRPGAFLHTKEGL